MRADGLGKRSKVEVGGDMDWDEDESKRRKISQVEIMRLKDLVGEWVEEIECGIIEEEEWEEMVRDAWDDVHEGHRLDPEKVMEGRREELSFMDKRGILGGQTDEGMLGGDGSQTSIGEMGGHGQELDG